jgi:hypothetical protein
MPSQPPLTKSPLLPHPGDLGSPSDPIDLDNFPPIPTREEYCTIREAEEKYFTAMRATVFRIERTMESLRSAIGAAKALMAEIEVREREMMAGIGVANLGFRGMESKRKEMGRKVKKGLSALDKAAECGVKLLRDDEDRKVMHGLEEWQRKDDKIMVEDAYWVCEKIVELATKEDLLDEEPEKTMGKNGELHIAKEDGKQAQN